MWKGQDVTLSLSFLPSLAHRRHCTRCWMRPWHARAVLAGLFAGALDQRGCQLGLDMDGRPLRAARE